MKQIMSSVMLKKTIFLFSTDKMLETRLKVNNYPKNRFITSMISKDFTKTFPSIYVPSVINRFVFGLGFVVYFIIQ